MATMKHPIEDTIRVLFIEDDPAVAEMYKLKLELDGYQVKVVSNDDQVMQEAAALRPDMIFLDLRMGEELGIATLQRLRATDGPRHLPVISRSAPAGNHIRLAEVSGQNRRHPLQYRVSCRVTAGVVHLLEPIDIEHDHRERLGGRGTQPFFERLFEGASVREPG